MFWEYFERIARILILFLRLASCEKYSALFLRGRAIELLGYGVFGSEVLESLFGESVIWPLHLWGDIYDFNLPVVYKLPDRPDLHTEEVLFGDLSNAV